MRVLALFVTACGGGVAEEPPPECVAGDVYCGDQAADRPSWTACCDEYDCWYESGDGWRIYCHDDAGCTDTAAVMSELLCSAAASG